MCPAGPRVQYPLPGTGGVSRHIEAGSFRHLVAGSLGYCHPLNTRTRSDPAMLKKEYKDLNSLKRKIEVCKGV